VILGALFELILVCSNIGTSIMLFPFLKKHNESIALGYVCFRLLEAVVISVGIISVLSLLTLSQEFVEAAAPNAAYYQTSGTLLKAIHDWTFLLGPNFLLGVNTMLYSYLLYQSKLVPRVPIPVATYEMILAVWLIVKGFNLSISNSPEYRN
jgi:hypothetical protein